MGSICTMSLHLMCSLPFPPKQSNTTTKSYSTLSSLNSRKNSLSKISKTNRALHLQRARATVDRKELDENPEGIISGEWPQNFSLLSYDDLRAYLEPNLFKDKTQPSAILEEVMSTTIRTASADQTLEEIDHHFELVTGLPVVDDRFRCIGIVSKRDKERASNGLKSKVNEVMSSPAITLSPGKTVLEAAALMLKSKIHRIPIVNEGGQVVGMVSRTDIFKALESLPV
ncbi:uncharacterized protein LOC131240706 [Magnolia sinica]|uniref:uncharacterized protein LOC131240706 n=1 Tax=Magnolia sinica TaxID=86752 RepID=UPI00265893C2|nr:uncharacterized protein LOC131240706 [Magnolia sinica]